MCGIVGAVDWRKPLSQQMLHKATAALGHRGPDGQAVWLAADGCAGLGHTRLSIVADDGVQPIAGEDDLHQIVVNGEFYDFVAIRNRLIAAGHRFRSEIDSEIALHLYEAVGVDCLQQLHGEFAFILWDARSRTLFAARDRFGVKPLFYTIHGDQLWLASEAKALFAAGLPAAWNEQALYSRLYGCFHNDQSLFEGVHQLPPGHYLLARDKQIHVERYWDVDFPRRRSLHAPDSVEARRQVGDLLEQAVLRRLQGQSPIGCLLSGGLDSSTVLALAAAASHSPIDAFSVAFEGDGYDESRKATIAAAHVGARLHVVHVDDEKIADNFADACRYGEMLHYNVHGVARFILSRAIQQAGYRSVMAGEGADELFAGYGFLPGQTSERQGGRLRRLLRTPDAAERAIGRVSPSALVAARLLDVPARLTGYFGGTLQLLEQLLAPDFVRRRQHDLYLTFLRQFEWRRSLIGREPVRQITYLWLRSIFAGYHLAADRLDMAHAVEVRLPFLDTDLFEYGQQLPIDLLRLDGRPKGLLYETARPLIAAETYQAAKHGFVGPPAMLRPGSRLRQLLQDTLRGSTPPLIDRPAVVRLLDTGSATAPASAVDALLLMLLSVTLLHKQYGL